jgi:hypothetical protein
MIQAVCPLPFQGPWKEAIIARLRAADALSKAAIKVMGDLALRDDPECAELGAAIDAYEEKP